MSETGSSIMGRRLALAAVLLAVCSASGSDCTGTSTGMIPINDLAAGLYLGQYQGGLYPNGLNTPPLAHHNAGVNFAHAVQPLDINGNPDPAGSYVLMSIGMSNTTQEFCCHPGTFMGQAAVNSDVNHDALVIVDGARGGQTASTWDDPTDQNYDRIRDLELAPLGLSEAQVQAVWVKVASAIPQVSLPDSQADAYTLLGQMGGIARALKVRYPNVKVVFYSSRIYAGYADTTLNPEPYAYESGFAAKWVIEAQITQMQGGGIDPIAGDLHVGIAPWIAWGPYMWADGLTPRSDGLIWECADLQSDGTHPSESGETKVGTMLMDFFLNSPYAAPWFRDTCPSDWNSDGTVNSLDFTAFLNDFAAGHADFNGDTTTDSLDFIAFLNAFIQGC
jgi:hypothetical protein